MGVEDKTLRLFALYDGTQADEGIARTATIADDAGNKMGKAGALGGARFAAGIDEGTTKAGGSLSKLGNSLGNWGIPFSGSIKKIGDDLSNVQTRGKGFAEAMSALGGVTVASLVGVGVESVHLADQFDTAQANLQTAVKNSGNSWDAYKGKIDAAYNSAAKLGFENNDVASALATLTTATQNPTKALDDLSTVENIARFRHESLSDASAQLAKILGGNTRLLAQWGINLDVGSGKLHSIQQAEEAQQKAQLTLQTTQAKINDGQLTGINASAALASAQLSLRNASLNLKESQQAIPDILDAINQRTKDAATNFGKTLPGELQTGRAEIHNLGVELGTGLEPAIQGVIGAGGKFLGLLESSKPLLYTFAGVVGGIATASVAALAWTTGTKVVGALSNMVSTVGSTATSIANKVGIIDLAAREEAAQQQATTAVIEESQAAIQSAWATTAAAADSIAAEIDGSFNSIGIAAQSSMGDAVTAFAGLDADMTAMAATVSTEAASVDASITSIGTAARGAAGEVAGLKSGLAGLKFPAFLGLAGVAAGTLAGAALATHAAATYRVQNPYGAAFADIVNSQTTAGRGGARGELNLENQITTAAQLRAAVGGMIPDAELNQIINRIQAGQYQSQQAARHKLFSVSSGGSSTSSTSPKTPGSGIPSLGGVPALSGATPVSSALTPAELALELQGIGANAGIKLAAAGGSSLSQQSGTLRSLTSELTAAHASALSKLESELNATHNATLTKLAGTLETSWESAQAKLTSILDADTKAAQSKEATLQSAITSNSLNALRTDVTGVHATELQQLRKELIATDTAKGKAEAASLLSVFQQAQTQLASDMLVKQETANADLLQLQATQLQGLTQLETDASNQEVQAMKDAASTISDAMTATATAITDATQAMNDASASQVSAIGDQAQTQADTLKERGLYGLNLLAQQAQVTLDQMKTGYDATLGGLQQAVDAAKASGDTSISTAQGLIDQAAQAQNALVAAAQQNLDSVTAQQNALVAQAQGGVDAVAQGTQQQQQQAQAALQQAQAQAAATESQAQSSLSAAQAQANIVNGQAQAALSGAQGNAAVIIAQAQQALASAQDQANVAEANQQAIIQILQAQAATQFAGSGLNVNIVGLAANNAAAISSEVSWLYRTKMS